MDENDKKLYTLDDMIDAFIVGSNDTIKNKKRVIELLIDEGLIELK